jgi:hypothetical protein
MIESERCGVVQEILREPFPSDFRGDLMDVGRIKKSLCTLTDTSNVLGMEMAGFVTRIGANLVNGGSQLHSGLPFSSTMLEIGVMEMREPI